MKRKNLFIVLLCILAIAAGVSVLFAIYLHWSIAWLIVVSCVVLLFLVIAAEVYSRHGIVAGCLFIFIIYILCAIAIPNFFSMCSKEGHIDSNIKVNMHTLQLTIEDISDQTGGSYPANLKVKIAYIDSSGKKKKVKYYTIAGSKSDTVFAIPAEDTLPILLPRQHYVNPFDNKKPVLICTRIDPPVWSKDNIGIVYYVPLDIKGEVAKNYKIYGAGKKGLLPDILSNIVINAPDQNK